MFDRRMGRSVLVVTMTVIMSVLFVLVSPFGLLGQDARAAERPILPPGGTNWDVNAHNAGPLVTQDLNTQTVTQVAQALLGIPAPAISNVTYTGNNIMMGTFSGGTGIIGFENGIILSSGNIASVVGPNVDDGTSTDHQLPGDADLTALSGFPTNDAAVLEFDFECADIQSITFEYVFASEEYNEYINSSFNDAFAIFVNGVNIALLPDASGVDVQGVNCGDPYNPPGGGVWCSLFRNNDLQDGGGTIDTEMDGLTVVLVGTANVNPGLNNIKIAIADASDNILDSDVFIRAGSMVCASGDIPTLSEWGLIILFTLAICGVIWTIVRRKRSFSIA